MPVETLRKSLRNAPTYLENIQPLLAQYQHFIVDLWGVLHDGTHPYPQALSALQTLKQNGRQIILLSNAPRRAVKAQETLRALGFMDDLYDAILTSGEASFHAIRRDYPEAPYFYIGPEKDRDLPEGLRGREVPTPKQAEYCLVTGYDYFGEPFESKLPQAKAALEAGLPMICANPDRKVVRQAGEIMCCAGLLGEWYQQQGGQVTFYGKPYHHVYDECLASFRRLSGRDVSPSSICCIGDGPHTDIAGANRAGMASLLVTGGIMKAHYAPHTSPEAITAHAAAADHPDEIPTYIIDAFRA